jgi:hypothetical protein
MLKLLILPLTNVRSSEILNSAFQILSMSPWYKNYLDLQKLLISPHRTIHLIALLDFSIMVEM